MHWNKARRDDYLLTAFEYFDRDRSGYITHDELQKACEDFGIEGNQLEDIIQEVDQNNVYIFFHPHLSCIFKLYFLLILHFFFILFGRMEE